MIKSTSIMRSVGKKDGKLYAISRLTPVDDGRLGFLISNLNAIHLFPKEKALDGTKLRNLLLCTAISLIGILILCLTTARRQGSSSLTL